MKYKMICLDIDGTLLNSQGSISEANLNAISRAYEKDVHIVVSTGRLYADAVNISDSLGVSSAVVSSNGSFIVDKSNDKVIYKKPLTQIASTRLLEIAENYQLVVSYHTANGEFCSANFNDYVNKIRDKDTQLFHQMATDHREIVKDNEEFRSILSNQHSDILKCVLFSEDTDFLENLRAEIYADLEDLEIVSSAYNNIEITSNGVSKGKALNILAEYYSIDPKDTLAMGDSENDFSLLKSAGIGIAMKNASKQLKEVADLVTESNDDDGVAKTIERFILNQE